MKIDWIIRNGHVVDPSQKIDHVMDIGIKDGLIAETGLDTEAVRTVDAEGCYVFPGLIDFHTHIFYTGSTMSVNPAFYPATGVTASVDAGTAGFCNFPAFYEGVIMNSPVRIKCYLCMYGAGQPDMSLPEMYESTKFSLPQIARTVKKYSDVILGLKIRYSKGIASPHDSLEATVRLARELGTHVCVHTTNPPAPLDGVADFLDKDDVYCHMYQGVGDDTILEKSDGSIKKSIYDARKRGVIFDVANGKTNFSFAVALPAVRRSFWPDIISTDWTLDKLNYSPHAKTLPYVMAKFLKMGMSLFETVRAVTETPARLMGMEEKIGTLKPGSLGDIAIFKKIPGKAVHQDFFGTVFETDEFLIPQMTMIGGDIVFCQEYFALA